MKNSIKERANKVPKRVKRRIDIIVKAQLFIRDLYKSKLTPKYYLKLLANNIK